MPRVDRRLSVPWWAAAIVATWLAGIVTFEALTPGELSLCHFKQVTGLPCPTCGTTRAVKSIATGRLMMGFAFNPMMVTALALGFAWLALRVGFGRNVVLVLTRNQRRAAWTLVGMAVLANWAYLVARGV